jgi:hypothetical protein
VWSRANPTDRDCATTWPQCEVDSCNEHVGQGGGQPHWHGDPFSDQTTHKCLYGPSNYTAGGGTAAASNTNHPPVIGFSFDGHLIYGRHLSDSAPGFAAPLLDACGGHKHATASDDGWGNDLSQTYHYHVQAFDATDKTGASYKATTTGPFQCWKAQLSASEGSSALLTATASATYKTKNEMGYRCCGMTDYHVLTGITMATTDYAASSTCAVPVQPANGAYAAGTFCATQGATMLSGYECTVTCSTGFCSVGSTKCVKGVITETSTCVASSGACAYTAAGAAAMGSTSAATAAPTPAPAPGSPTVSPTAAPTPAPTLSPTGTCTGTQTTGDACAPTYTETQPCQPGCTAVSCVGDACVADVLKSESAGGRAASTPRGAAVISVAFALAVAAASCTKSRAY